MMNGSAKTEVFRAIAAQVTDKATKTIGASVRTRNLSVSPPAHNITMADAVVPEA